MKNIVSLSVLTVAVSFFCGCGDASKPAPAKKAAKPAAKNNIVSMERRIFSTCTQTGSHRIHVC